MTRHPYQRLRAQQFELPEVGISEEDNIRSLHLGSPTIQSSMNLDDPSELVLSYSQAMMGWLLFQDPPAHITQIGLGGGSFARWLAEFCQDDPTRRIGLAVIPAMYDMEVRCASCQIL